MTKDEVIIEMCKIRSLVFRSINDYNYPCDGFCSLCEEIQGKSWNFQSTSDCIDYIRDAVVKQLKADNITIANNFDPITGKEL